MIELEPVTSKFDTSAEPRRYRVFSDCPGEGQWPRPVAVPDRSTARERGRAGLGRARAELAEHLVDDADRLRGV